MYGINNTKTGKAGSSGRSGEVLRQPVIWIYLTPMDSHPERFWSLLGNALEGWDKDLAAEMQRTRFPNSEPAAGRFLQKLSAAAERSGKIILAIDGIGFISDGSVREFIDDLMSSGNENISFVLADGDQAHIKPAGSGTVFQSDGLCLQFTRQAVMVYYSALGILLGEACLDAVLSITEGWPEAVKTLAVYLPRNHPISEKDIDNSVTSLFRLFENQYFQPSDPNIQKSMILLSLLETCPVELMEKTAGSGGKLLSRALDEIPFIRFNATTDSFYFHGLFKRFLSNKQSSVAKKKRNSFLADAARWYEKNGMAKEAMGCYLSSGGYNDAAKVLSNINLAADLDEAADILNMLEQIPETRLRENLRLWLYKACAYFVCGDIIGGLRCLNLLEEHVKSVSPDDESKSILGEVCILRGLLSVYNGRGDYLKSFKKAEKLLPGGSSVLSGRFPDCVGDGSAFFFFGDGPFNAGNMNSILSSLKPYRVKLFGGWGMGAGFLAAAEYHYYCGEFEAAISNAGKAIETAAAHKQWDIAGGANYIFIKLNIALGRLDEAEYSLSALHGYSGRIEKSQVLLPDIADYLIYHHTGLDHRAAGWIKDREPLYKNCVLPNSGRELCARSVYSVSRKRYYPALAGIDTAMGICSITGQWFPRLYLLILKAIVLNMTGQHTCAAGVLNTARELIGENGIIMPFAEFGNDMRGLIKDVRKFAAPENAVDEKWLCLIEEKTEDFIVNKNRFAGDYLRRYPQDPFYASKLTRREFETLQLVCKGLRNDEIARRMGVETNSVKTTLNRVYRKIGASGRGDAVRIGLSEKIIQSGGHK